METIPTVMESVMLSEQGRDKLEYGCMDIPVPRKGQVLIKVVAVPINPTDLYMMEGKYGKYMNLQYPHTPGFEGAGYVVQSGGGILAWRLKGKRVAFTRMDQRMVGGKLIKIGGSMAQYCLTNAYQWAVLDDDVSFLDACSYFINPITALGLVEPLIENKAKSVVITAGFSQLGKMLIRLCHDNDIRVIATVRKQEQVDILSDEFNVEWCLNTEDEDFIQSMKNVISTLEPSYLLECISGSLSGQIISCMPCNSTWIIYGALTQQKIWDIDPFAIMMRNIKITGFNLADWMKTKSTLSKYFIVRKIGKMIKTNLKTEVDKIFPLSEIHEAIEWYQSNMSKGKIVLSPFPNNDYINQ